MSARLRAVYERVTSWQRKTFPMPDADHAKSLLAHMRKELAEIEAAPLDIEERADIAILAMGAFDRLGMDPGLDVDASAMMLWGYWRPSRAINELKWLIGQFETGNNTWRLVRVLAGCTRGIPSLDSEDKFLDAIEAKMVKNEERRWPTPDQQVPGQPVEHIREEELQFDAVTAMLAGDKIDEEPSEIEILRASVAELEAQGGAWRSDAVRLLAIHQEVRELVGAVPNEGVADAVRRLVVELNDRRSREGGR